MHTHSYFLVLVVMVGKKIEDNLLFCRGECEGGIIDGSVDVDDVAFRSSTKQALHTTA